MKFYPDHIEGNVEDATACFPRESGSYHHYYQVVCRCGSRRFALLQSDRRSVIACCEECGHSIVVHDLAHYPAATKLPGEETYFSLARHVAPGADASVFVMYEYGELDQDQEFDRNGITWCQVFAEDEAGQICQVFDDETA